MATGKCNPKQASSVTCEVNGECYICGTELSRHEDSGRCVSCMDQLAEEHGDGWDN